MSKCVRSVIFLQIVLNPVNLMLLKLILGKSHVLPNLSLNPYVPCLHHICSSLSEGNNIFLNKKNSFWSNRAYSKCIITCSDNVCRSQQFFDLWKTVKDNFSGIWSDAQFLCLLWLKVKAVRRTEEVKSTWHILVFLKGMCWEVRGGWSGGVEGATPHLPLSSIMP